MAAHVTTRIMDEALVLMFSVPLREQLFEHVIGEKLTRQQQAELGSVEVADFVRTLADIPGVSGRLVIRGNTIQIGWDHDFANFDDRQISAELVLHVLEQLIGENFERDWPT